MGLSAPALYRYFPSHEDLIADLCTSLYDELAAVLTHAWQSTSPLGPGPSLVATMHAFRTWAVEHPPEFGLVFASPIPNQGDPDHEQSPMHQAGLRFAQIFGAILAELWREQQFSVPADDEIPTALRTGMKMAALEGQGVPLGLAVVMLRGWTRLYGLVALEATGHLGWCMDDGEPFFAYEIARLTEDLGIKLDT